MLCFFSFLYIDSAKECLEKNNCRLLLLCNNTNLSFILSYFISWVIDTKKKIALINNYEQQQESDCPLELIKRADEEKEIYEKKEGWTPVTKLFGVVAVFLSIYMVNKDYLEEAFNHEQGI